MFNSKFGVGVLKHPGYNVGGGIGEAALLGAAFGGAKSLATGEDLLEGALLGGLTGGAMSGVTGAMFGKEALTGAGTVASTADDAAALALEQAKLSSANMLTPTMPEIGMANSFNAVTGAPIANQGIASASNQMVGQNAISGGLQGGIPDALQTARTAEFANTGRALSDKSATNIFGDRGFDVRDYTNPDTMLAKGADWWEKQGLGGQAMYSGLGGLAYGAMNPNTPEMPKLEEQKSKLAGYNRDGFTPYMAEQPDPYYAAQYRDYRTAAQGGVMNSYAEGGIAALANGGMGNNLNFPQGRLDTTQYATPTQMPTSAQVVNADYEQATDPYLGSPLKMAEGGVARYAPGGQVYYDPEKNSYYTQTSVGPFGGIFSRFGNQRPNGMDIFGGTPFSDERTYITGGMPGAGGMSNFQSPEITPKIYQQITQAASDPAIQQAVTQAMPNYSLADSLPLLQSTNPGIAAMYSQPSAPVEIEKKAEGGIAGYNLGGYAAGGNPRLLKGPGDGMSDNIPATIGNRQPARLADGEFVVPADVVSHLGNGSTDAGAKHLYGMMDKVRKARTGNKKQGKQIKPEKFLPV